MKQMNVPSWRRKLTAPGEVVRNGGCGQAFRFGRMISETKKLRLLQAVAAVAMAFLGTSFSNAATVAFDQPGYIVSVNTNLALEIGITYDTGEPTDLFSYGVRIFPVGTVPMTLKNIDVPPALDFLSVVGPPALRDISVLGVKGSVDAFANPLQFYFGSNIATFLVSFSQQGVYTLDLGFFNTAGPNEDIFVTGGGATLDQDIVFQSTVVTVIPEPSRAALAALGIVAVLFRRRQRRPARRRSGLFRRRRASTSFVIESDCRESRLPLVRSR